MRKKKIEFTIGKRVPNNNPPEYKDYAPHIYEIINPNQFIKCENNKECKKEAKYFIEVMPVFEGYFCEEHYKKQVGCIVV